MIIRVDLTASYDYFSTFNATAEQTVTFDAASSNPEAKGLQSHLDKS